MDARGELLKAQLEPFESASERQWEVLQRALYRARNAIAYAVAVVRNRWSELGDNGEEVGQQLKASLRVEDVDDVGMVFELLSAIGRPYVVLVLDVVSRVNEERPPGVMPFRWASGLSREAAVMALRGLADYIEANPEQVQGVTDAKA